MAHILIIDDDVIIAEVASQALINAGHACGWVTSGEAAFKVLKHRHPDLILLDQSMPGMSGTEVLRKLRASPRFYDLPVIMFSAIAAQGDIERAHYAGATDFISKPFKPQQLVLQIEDMLQARARRVKHKSLETLLQEHSGQAYRPRQTVMRPV